MRFQARLCRSCGLRFPVEFQSPLGRTCPACGASTEDVDAPWTAETVVRQGVAPGPRLEALLDNVRSLRNVGAMFRSADGAGVSTLHLGGFTPTPSHPKLAKTALGSEKSVAWQVHKDAAAAAASLSRDGKRLWALEGGPSSCSIFEVIEPAGIASSAPIVLVVGHEVSGIDPRILDHCERRIAIPMAGIKNSLNVAVAFGIAVYVLRHTLR